MFTKKLDSIYRVPKRIKKELRKYNVPGGWDKKDDVVMTFKKNITMFFKTHQENKCAYCELPIRSPEVDHIAPKGGVTRQKHFEYSFLPVNLVWACHECNSGARKGQTDTIKTKGTHYTDSNFTIVHPYLDDPTEYFITSCGGYPVVKPDASSLHKEKARRTIKMFGLDREIIVMQLAWQKIAENHPVEYAEMISRVSEYKPL